MLRIGVIGERDPANETHRTLDDALRHSSASLGTGAMARWVGTQEVADEGKGALGPFDCLFIAPGSPYRSLDGALSAIAFAREEGVPVLGTCAGFQHMVIELARDLAGFPDAHHAEVDPTGPTLVIVASACSLWGETMPVQLVPGTKVAKAYGTLSATEKYYCRFELNASYLQDLQRVGMAVTGTGPDGEARVIELTGHPFFMGTLFVPHVASTPDHAHPVVTALLAAALG